MARGFEVTTGLVMQQGLFEENVAAQHRLGTRVQLADGRVFYYALAGEGLSQGLMCIAALNNDTVQELAIAAVTVVDDKSVTLTAPATNIATANMYAEGFIHTRETGSGVGQCMKIKSHPSAGSTDPCVFTLYDPIKIALVTTGTADVSASPFYGVIQDVNEENNPAGIPLIAVTDAYYFWLQTWGVASCLSLGTIPTGSPLVLASTAGAIAPLSTATNSLEGGLYPIVGELYGTDSDTGEYTAIKLMLFP